MHRKARKNPNSSEHSSSSSSSSSTSSTPKNYGLKDLPTELAHKLTYSHQERFDYYLDRCKFQPPQLPVTLQTEIQLAINEFEKTLALFDTDIKLIHFKEDYLNRDYHIIEYQIRISFLYFKLHNKEKAHDHLHQALIQCKHPNLTRVYFSLKNINLLREEHALTYLINILQSFNESLGTKYNREEINAVFLSAGYKSKEQGLIDFSNQLYLNYKTKNDTQAIEKLITILTSSNEVILRKHAPITFYSFLMPYLEQADFDTVDAQILKYDSLLSQEHYARISECAQVKFDQDPQNVKYARLSIKYMEKAASFGSPNYQLSLARLLVYLGKDVLKDNENPVLKGMEIIKKIQKDLGKSQTAESKKLRGMIHHLYGRIYELGLMAHDPNYPLDAKLAFKEYQLAVSYNNLESLHDLGCNYHLGQGTSQDLTKADEYLTLAYENKIIRVGMDLGTLRLMQASKETNDKLRDKLLDDGIAKIKELLALTPPLCDSNLLRCNIVLVSLYFAKDTKIKLIINPQTQQVNHSFSIDAIRSYSENNAHPNAHELEKHLHQACGFNNKDAYRLLALFHLCGNYLEEDFDKAEQLYKKCVQLGGTPQEFITLYLIRSTQASSAALKQQYLLEALKYHRLLLKRVDSLEDKKQLEELFTECIKAYHNKTCISESTIKKHRFNGNIALPQTPEPVEKQLKKAIEAALIHLLQSQVKDKNFESELINLFAKIAFIVTSFRKQVPLYAHLLHHLSNLEEQIFSIFVALSYDTQIALIKSCSLWPLVRSKEGPMANMVSLTRPSDTSLGMRLSLIMALVHMKHPEGLFEDDVYRILFPKIEQPLINSITDASRLLYIYAIVQANCNQSTSVSIKEELALIHKPLIECLNTNSWNANTDNLSQLYHGINFLAKIYPEYFSKLPDNLNNLIQLNEQLIKQDDAVTISKQQQRVFEVLKSMDANFQHEAFVGGRRVDFYNPVTKEIVFYHGPSHYVYTQEGKACCLNPATILCENTLKLQGYTVIHIDYFRWQEMEESKQTIDLLKSSIPSLKDWSKNQLSPPPSKQLGPGQSSASFWSELTISKTDATADQHNTSASAKL